MQIHRGDVALITGASRGIGRHIAMALARRGMDLVLAARSQDGLDAVAAEVRSATGVTVWTLPVDLGDRDEAAALPARAEAAAGRVDVLVNNAGLDPIYRPDEIPLEELAAMTDVNLLAPMLLTRMVLPGMIGRGRGHVVNVASMSGRVAMSYTEPYTATKHGLLGFTLALRLTAQDQAWGVGASAVCPGFISGEGMHEDMKREFGVTTPKLFGSLPVERVADAVVEAIEKDLAEVLVSPGAPRVMVAVIAAAPRLFEWTVRRLDLAAIFRSVMTQRKSAATVPDA
jgi:short-subunit dehydrogenase